MDPTKPPTCHLLFLPAELRLRIYSFALAPTASLYLSSTRQKRNAISPKISPAVLRTCKQIYHEAQDILYAENTVNIMIDAHDTCWPTISESRLPQRVLERLEHVCVLLDCTNFFRASYGDVDFLPFVALERLKSLRLRVLASADGSQDGGNAFPQFCYLATEILERIAPNVIVMYGADAADSLLNGESDGSIPVASLTTERADSTRVSVAEVPSVDLLDCMQGFETARRGCKAQRVADVWAEYRGEMSSAWRGMDSAS